MNTQRFFKGAIFTATILWAALTFSNVLLGLVTFMVPPPRLASLDPTMEMIFLGLAVAAAVTSFVLPSTMYAKALGGARVEVQPADPGPEGQGPAARFAQPMQAARKAVALGNTRLILSMALSEVVSMFGLMLHMQGGPMSLSTGLIAAGTILALVRYPSPARLIGPFERALGATFAASEGGSY